MAELPFMPIAIGDYMADCSHLTDAEHGRYLLLLMVLWAAPAQRIPDDDAWLARRFSRSLERIKEEIRPLIKEFCKGDGNWIKQKRLSKEFAFVIEKGKKQSARAKSGWNKRKEASHGNAERHASGNALTPTLTLTPTPTQIEEKKEMPNGIVACATAEDISQAFRLFNDSAKRTGWPEAQKIDDGRKKKMLGRLKDAGGLEGFAIALGKAEASQFLTEKWPLKIDWLLKAANFTKLMEGNYDNRAESESGLASVLATLSSLRTDGH